MKDKYIEEAFPYYCDITSNLDPNRVNVFSVGNGVPEIDIVVSPEVAKALVADRKRLVDAFIALAQRFDDVAPEAFSELWYNTDFARKPLNRG